MDLNLYIFNWESSQFNYQLVRKEERAQVSAEANDRTGSRGQEVADTRSASLSISASSPTICPESVSVRDARVEAREGTAACW